jgi:nucleoside phosphorylase
VDKIPFKRLDGSVGVLELKSAELHDSRLRKSIQSTVSVATLIRFGECWVKGRKVHHPGMGGRDPLLVTDEVLTEVTPAGAAEFCARQQIEMPATLIATLTASTANASGAASKLPIKRRARATPSTDSVANVSSRDSSRRGIALPPSDSEWKTPGKGDRPPTIGIITALPVESAAVCAALGNAHRIHVPAGGISSGYWMADVSSANGGLHRVVLAQSGVGTNVAAIRAGVLLNHFQSIESIIMCGIAGGVPHRGNPDQDVRLGDIVVSNIKGVVQYDFIKRTVGRKKVEFIEEVRAASHRPSAALLDAVSFLAAEEYLGQRPWEPLLAAGLSRLDWVRPDPGTDVLADVLAAAPKTVDRKRRVGQPRVFTGPIASANTLLKDANRRDSLRDQFGVRAIEMEGAGVVDATWTYGIGYLVVRGICDYADSNKNDDWQDYAAMAAAAYVRALAESMPGPEHLSGRRTPDVASSRGGHGDPGDPDERWTAPR